MLLQIMEDGHLADANGRKVDFRNTIVIMTSNIGAETIKRKTGSSGSPARWTRDARRRASMRGCAPTYSIN